MRLNFIIDKNYVFLHAINSNQNLEPFSGWASFTNKIWEKNPELYYFLSGSPEYTTYGIDLIEIAKRSGETLEELKSTAEYKRLIQETETYREFVKAQWEGNSVKALEIIENISGLKLPDKSIDVYLTHPKLKNGFTLDNDRIAWGHSEDFANYSTVYLCHELMHIVIKHDNSDVAHAAIELLTDNELRIRLNKSGDYFEFPGHKHLTGLEKEILPEWNKFLDQDNRNILDFIEKLKKIHSES